MSDVDSLDAAMSRAGTGSVGRHASHQLPSRGHPLRRAILIIVGLLVLVALVLGGIGFHYGSQLYRQAKQVESHEQAAMLILQRFKSAKDKASLDAVAGQIPQLQAQTKAADDIAHGDLWDKAKDLPVYGGDIKAIQGMTHILRDLSDTAMPGFVKAYDGLVSADLSVGGSINLQPIAAAAKTMAPANADIRREYQEYLKLPVPKFAQVKAAYDLGKAQLKSVLNQSQGLSDGLDILPGFMGSTGRRTYLVSTVSNAEARSSGGLTGTLGTLVTDNGAMSVGTFYPDSDFDGVTVQARDEMALRPSALGTVKNSGMNPDFAKVADEDTRAWNGSAHAGAPIAGVIQIDPVFLQAINQVCGPYTLANGVSLSGQNTADYLLNTVYITVPLDQQNALFQQAAAQAFANLASGMSFARLQALGKVLPGLAKARHISMTASDPQIQSYLTKNGFTPGFQVDPANPEVGVYYNEWHSSKIDWYIDRQAAITCADCSKLGGASYRVSYTLRNVLAPAQVAGLPAYITGTDKGLVSGAAYPFMLLSAPADGTIADLKVSGTAAVTTNDQVRLNGKLLNRLQLRIDPGKTATLSFTVTVSPQATAQLSLDQTPLPKQ